MYIIPIILYLFSYLGDVFTSLQDYWTPQSHVGTYYIKIYIVYFTNHILIQKSQMHSEFILTLKKTIDIL